MNLNTLKSEPMTTTMSPQQNWYDLCNILKDLLTTVAPLIFGELFYKKKVILLSNEGYNSLDKNHFNNSMAEEVWADLFRQAITDIFMHRLLGSQSDMDSYRKRSTKYLKTLNNMLGTNNGDDNMVNITNSFFELLKDYICQNMPGISDEVKKGNTHQVMTACKEIYAAHRLRDDKQEELDRKFYLPFEEHTYSYSLLALIDEISADTENHPLIPHYLVVAEYIHALFIYVYMIEFVKYFPSVKGTPREKDPAMEQGRKNNLFTCLAQMDFVKAYNEQKRKSDKTNKINNGST